jgi:anti-sigma B factor antagonist
MSEGAQTSLSVCVRDHAACVRIVGQAKFTAATDFKRLILQLEQDCQEIILDLTQCTMMDSTFLGVMTAAARRCEIAQRQGQHRVLGLFHPTEKVVESLENLDVLRVFKVMQDPPQFGAFQRVEHSSPSRQELTRTCWEAHDTLMRTNPDNERRFRDATEFFRKNLGEDEGKE